MASYRISDRTDNTSGPFFDHIEDNAMFTRVFGHRLFQFDWIGGSEWRVVERQGEGVKTYWFAPSRDAAITQAKQFVEARKVLQESAAREH